MGKEAPKVVTVRTGVYGNANRHCFIVEPSDRDITKYLFQSDTSAIALYQELKLWAAKGYLVKFE